MAGKPEKPEIFKQTLPVSSVSFNMVKVIGDIFDMGGESWAKDSLPVHPVKLSDYWIGQHPVTQEIWETVMGSDNNPSYFRGKKRPVESISWEQIVEEFLPGLNKLTKELRGKTTAGLEYCLPTEAQWEFAAQGGIEKKQFDYSGSEKIDDIGWHYENSHGETKPVGLKQPNELQLYDLTGNVWEWCNDWYGSDYYKQCKKRGVEPNPAGPAKGDDRVRRCGSWINIPRYCCVSSRNYDHPSTRFNSIGFRLVLVSLPG